MSIRSHMEFLAGDALNGRGSGTRDEWMAASYLGSEMRQIGLEPLGDAGGFVQQVALERTETSAPPVLSVTGRRFTHGKEIRVLALGATRVEGPLQKFKAGTPVPAGVVLLAPSFANIGLGAGAAAAVLVPGVDLPQETGSLPSPPARLAGFPAAAAGRPTIVSLDKDAFAALEALADGTTVAIEAETKPGQTTTHTWNAVGRLTGRDPKAAAEVILLSAHLDHLGSRPGAGAASADTIYNGADDDASGTIAVLELARALAQGPRPKRTIVFAFFGSEETGGYGSRYFVDRPVVPLTEIVANLQFEMIGRADAAVPAHTLWLTGFERSNLGATLAKQGARLVQDPHPEQDFFERSDNFQFARRGVIAHTVSSYGLHKDYHRPSDDVRSIDFAHMTDAIRSMLEPVRWLANSSFRPEWVAGKKP